LTIYSIYFLNSLSVAAWPGCCCIAGALLYRGCAAVSRVRCCIAGALLYRGCAAVSRVRCCGLLHDIT
jgi:hypothetical protein